MAGQRAAPFSSNCPRNISTSCRSIEDICRIQSYLSDRQDDIPLKRFNCSAGISHPVCWPFGAQGRHDATGESSILPNLRMSLRNCPSSLSEWRVDISWNSFSSFLLLGPSHITECPDIQMIRAFSYHCGRQYFMRRFLIMGLHDDLMARVYTLRCDNAHKLRAETMIPRQYTKCDDRIAIDRSQRKVKNLSGFHWSLASQDLSFRNRNWTFRFEHHSTYWPFLRLCCYK
jgi:hypothetical protein